MRWVIPQLRGSASPVIVEIAMKFSLSLSTSLEAITLKIEKKKKLVAISHKHEGFPTSKLIYTLDDKGNISWINSSPALHKWRGASLNKGEQSHGGREWNKEEKTNPENSPHADHPNSHLKNQV